MDLRCTSAAVAVAFGLLISACGDDEGGDAAAPALADLSGRTFTSTSVDGWTLVDGTAVVITFDDDGVSVSAGCNTMRGGAAITDGALVVAEPMASTMMACSEELMDQDQWLQGFLAAAPAVVLDGSELTLTTDDATLVAAS